MIDNEDRKVAFELIAAKMAASRQFQRAELNRMMYADGMGLKPYVPPQMRFHRLRRYVLNWREAVYAVGRAIIGRDVIPECDHDY